MIEWLATPIDPGRPHAIDAAAAWHARLMVAAWAFLLPLGVIAARYLKILPWQDWPRRLDNLLWWHLHRSLQYFGTAVTIVAILFAWRSAHYGAALHPLIGYATFALCVSQVLAAWLRGTKGGPTAPAADGSLSGDHYDMTPRRLAFEYWHKSAGYAALLAAVAAIITGLWLVNAPRWMPAGLLVWWGVLVAIVVRFERRGMVRDTYQAIWGPDPRHPGNRRRPIGINVHRLPDAHGEAGSTSGSPQ